MKTHLQTAHEYGVNKALEACGYTSPADVEKEAAALNLFPTDAPTDKLASVFANLKAKLG